MGSQGLDDINGGFPARRASKGKQRDFVVLNEQEGKAEIQVQTRSGVNIKVRPLLVTSPAGGVLGTCPGLTCQFPGPAGAVRAALHLTASPMSPFRNGVREVGGRESALAGLLFFFLSLL